MEATRKMIADDVWLTYLPDRKFKTGMLSAQFVTPLRRDTAAINALLPAVLRRGTVRCPDLGSLSAEMDRLYGARIDDTVRKKAERQVLGFVASFIDEAFVPGGEKLLEPVASLMGELVCEPVTRNGRFLSEYVEGERTNLVDAIRGILNDKQDYADLRLLEEMCGREPYGVSKFGDEKSAERITAQKLYAAYASLLSSARLELFYSGNASQERVEQALLSAFSALPRENVGELAEMSPHAPRSRVKTITEEMDVSQGKLSMGFSCGSENAAALLLGNAVFGGFSNSKLFLNVREKLSLCYYASSVYHRQKGLITVSSGVEFENFQQAYDEIMVQLKAIQHGEIEDWELEGARNTLLSGYTSLGDFQGRLENFYLGQAATGLNETPEGLARKVREATAEDVIEAMRTVKLDTVYFLKGKEAEA